MNNLRDINQARAQRQYKAHTGKLTNGDHFITIGNNIRDVFSGKGWHAPRRERLIKGEWVYQQGQRA